MKGKQTKETQKNKRKCEQANTTHKDKGQYEQTNTKLKSRLPTYKPKFHYYFYLIPGLIFRHHFFDIVFKE
jgi:hypothetical protein